MWVNILIAIAIGALTYGITLYIDGGQPPQPIVNIAPQTENSVVALNPYKSVPDFSFTTLDSVSHDISDFKGKIIVLNFWATWCPPCIVEMPALLSAAKAHDKDLILIALSSDLEKEPVDRFLEKLGDDARQPNVLFAIDEQSRVTRDLFQAFKLPETIIIGRDGQMHSRLIGANWQKGDLENIIRELQ
jgi:thiol-disulfide isomerase/thioredoxin